MKKRVKHVFLFLLFVLAIYYLVNLLPIDSTDKGDIKVLLLHNPALSKTFGHILDAYQSVLEEEGVPFKIVAPSFILSEKPAAIVKYFPVIIMPDGISRSLPSDMKFWAKEYLEQGGHLAVIFDSGSQDRKYGFLDRGIFADLVGLNYVIYNNLRDSNLAYTNGYLRFKDADSAAYFQIPPGKTNDKFFITGYSYGQLIFPMARVTTDPCLNEKDIYAYGVTENGRSFPTIILKKVISGNLLYANLPLGHLKANSDDLLIRSLLRTFLFTVAKIPHLMNTPGGKGGLVINWHIDWSEDWEGLEYMKQNGFFPKHIKYSIHNTAGNFTDRPGDRLGFDAYGKGHDILQSVVKYGTLGSHGGWAHNWFYQNILDGNFGKNEIEANIVRNNKCMESISGYPVTEYSAPNGVHPQPLATRILERNGVIAYYYTGDSGSAPNRTFFEKKMVSPNVIAFPVLPYREVASFFEMNRDGVTHKQLMDWFQGLLDFVIKNHTVRLIYSHSYDVRPYYPSTLKQFILEVDKQCQAGKLLAQPMSYFANYLKYFLKAKCRFHKGTTHLELRLNHPTNLNGIVVALPVDQYAPNPIKGVDIKKEKEYYYLWITENTDEKVLFIPYAHH